MSPTSSKLESWKYYFRHLKANFFYYHKARFKRLVVDRELMKHTAGVFKRMMTQLHSIKDFEFYWENWKESKLSPNRQAVQFVSSFRNSISTKIWKKIQGVEGWSLQRAMTFYNFKAILKEVKMQQLLFVRAGIWWQNKLYSSED